MSICRAHAAAAHLPTYLLDRRLYTERWYIIKGWSTTVLPLDDPAESVITTTSEAVRMCLGPGP
jgi:hypothetical protein